MSVALKRADGALIQAKKSGKHAYVVVEKNKLLDGFWASSPDYSLSISQIQEAFVSGSVELYLQPVFNTSFNYAVGYEALVRLHQGGRVVSPAVFLDSLYKLSRRGFSSWHYLPLDDLISKIPHAGAFGSLGMNEFDLGDFLFERLLQALLAFHPSSRMSCSEVSETTFKLVNIHRLFWIAFSF